jgi:glycosyltransferase involved in cell wall biosynthesis
MHEEKKVQKIFIKKHLGYLSAAPRVSTNPLAEANGPRSHVLGVIGAFRDLGWEVSTFIVGDRISQVVTQQSGKRLEKSILTRFAADIFRLISGPFQSIKAWLELHNKVGMVYERFAVLQTIGWIFKFMNIPWVLETNGLYFYEAKVERKSIVLNRVARLIEVWAYRHCDVLICVTNALKELVIQEAGIPAEKILVVPNGVDCIRFNPKLYTPKRFFAGPTIGFVSALIKWHRLDILLEVLGDLHREGIDFHMVVAGDGPMRSEWETLAYELELNERVKFLGQISWDEIPALLAGFDLGYVGNNPMVIGVMYHSPLKLYEYMAMGLPPLTVENDDSRHMIVSGQTGYLFKAGDKEDLKRILRLALQEVGKWEEMGIEARQQVLKHASWTSRVSIMLEGISQILN